VFGEWDEKLVAQLLALMTPGNARVDVQSTKWDDIQAVVGQVLLPALR